jgi:hypothetical protein
MFRFTDILEEPPAIAVVDGGAASMGQGTDAWSALAHDRTYASSALSRRPTVAVPAFADVAVLFDSELLYTTITCLDTINVGISSAPRGDATLTPVMWA